MWLAMPLSYGSFIHYTPPVLTGAFTTSPIFSFTAYIIFETEKENSGEGIADSKIESARTAKFSLPLQILNGVTYSLGL
jgi:hypothetical protein